MFQTDQVEVFDKLQLRICWISKRIDKMSLHSSNPVQESTYKIKSSHCPPDLTVVLKGKPAQHSQIQSTFQGVLLRLNNYIWKLWGIYWNWWRRLPWTAAEQSFSLEPFTFKSWEDFLNISGTILSNSSTELIIPATKSLIKKKKI